MSDHSKEQAGYRIIDMPEAAADLVLGPPRLVCSQCGADSKGDERCYECGSRFKKPKGLKSCECGDPAIYHCGGVEGVCFDVLDWFYFFKVFILMRLIDVYFLFFRVSS